MIPWFVRLIWLLARVGGDLAVSVMAVPPCCVLGAALATRQAAAELACYDVSVGPMLS